MQEGPIHTEGKITTYAKYLLTRIKKNNYAMAFSA